MVEVRIDFCIGRRICEIDPDCSSGPCECVWLKTYGRRRVYPSTNRFKKRCAISSFQSHSQSFWGLRQTTILPEFVCARSVLETKSLSRRRAVRDASLPAGLSASCAALCKEVCISMSDLPRVVSGPQMGSLGQLPARVVCGYALTGLR